VPPNREVTRAAEFQTFREEKVKTLDTTTRIMMEILKDRKKNS